MSHIMVNTKQIIAYCEREQAMQKRVYPGRIEAKKMTADMANLYYRIIGEYRLLCVEAANRGLDWEQVKQLVMEVKPKNELPPKPEQAKLFGDGE